VFLIVVFVFILPIGAVTPTEQNQIGSSSGGFITVGYGRINIEYASYDTDACIESPAYDKKWGTILLGGGYYIAGGKTQFEIDLYATGKKHLTTTTGDLIGGGTYVNNRSIRHWCIMLRLRQCIVSPFFISGGIGMFEEETVNENNTITGGNSWSRDYGAYAYGIDMRINSHLFFGVNRIIIAQSDLFNEYNDEFHPSRNATMGEFILLLGM
jgi:hypothetical protein